MFLAKLLIAWLAAAAIGEQVGGAVGVFVAALLALGWTVALCINDVADANERSAIRPINRRY